MISSNILFSNTTNAIRITDLEAEDGSPVYLLPQEAKENQMLITFHTK